MSLIRDSAKEEKLKILLNAQFRVKQQFERVDWKHAVLYPQIEALKAGKQVLGLDDGMTFDMVLVNEDPDPPQSKKHK